MAICKDNLTKKLFFITFEKLNIGLLIIYEKSTLSGIHFTQ